MEEKVILYTTHCPMCKGLEMKLKQMSIDYEECDDTEKMKAAGLTHAPALQVNDGPLMDYKEALNWLHTVRG